MAQERSDVLVRMPAALKRRLAREVEARGGNLNDVAVEILASRFAVPFHGSGRRAGRPSGKGDVLLRMPAELKEKLARRASERKRSVTQLIVETLDGLAKSGEAGNGGVEEAVKGRVHELTRRFPIYG